MSLYRTIIMLSFEETTRISNHHGKSHKTPKQPRRTLTNRLDSGNRSKTTMRHILFEKFKFQSLKRHCKSKNHPGAGLTSTCRLVGLYYFIIIKNNKTANTYATGYKWYRRRWTRAAYVNWWLSLLGVLCGSSSDWRKTCIEERAGNSLTIYSILSGGDFLPLFQLQPPELAKCQGRNLQSTHVGSRVDCQK